MKASFAGARRCAGSTACAPSAARSAGRAAGADQAHRAGRQNAALIEVKADRCCGRTLLFAWSSLTNSAQKPVASKKQPHTVGTKIIAVRNFGPIREGQPGVITGVVRMPYFFFWTRPFYLCTFFGNIKCAASPDEIDDYDHGHSLEDLEHDQSGLSPAEQLKAVLGKR